MIYKIALDGPSGAGKSTLAKNIASALNIVYVDTGALYRSVGLYMQKNSILPENTQGVIAALPKVKLQMKFLDGTQHIYLCGEDVKDSIRTPEISMYASKVSAIPEVRTFLLNTQRDIAKTTSVIMDGRDIGTVIFPDADVKIFLTASLEARARRRTEELAQKGINEPYEKVLAEMKERDSNDSTRKVAPAVAAKDAILLDNSDFSLEQTFQAALSIIKSRLAL
ncbi:MAG: (d)CMP kinase [Clostridia bacterium]|nr:(d)CMP kinase [Clostridia bacterium]